jgi:hypothetical protein
LVGVGIDTLQERDKVRTKRSEAVLTSSSDLDATAATVVVPAPKDTEALVLAKLTGADACTCIDHLNTDESKARREKAKLLARASLRGYKGGSRCDAVTLAGHWKISPCDNDFETKARLAALYGSGV